MSLKKTCFFLFITIIIQEGNMYHTVVIGGGCLGAATAISVQRKLNESGKGGKFAF